MWNKRKALAGIGIKKNWHFAPAQQGGAGKREIALALALRLWFLFFFSYSSGSTAGSKRALSRASRGPSLHEAKLRKLYSPTI